MHDLSRAPGAARRLGRTLVLLTILGGILPGCQTTAGDVAAAGSYQPGEAEREQAAPIPPRIHSTPGTDVPPPLPPRERYRPTVGLSRPRGEVYAGASFLASPAPGFGIEVGQVFARCPSATWAFELEGGWQDLGESFQGGTGSGEWAQVQGGVKASLLPCGRLHPTGRFGLAWFRATEDTEFIPEAGDYFGIHAGLGLEFDLTDRITTGPEISVMAASREGEFDPVYVPQVNWHVLWNF